MKIGMITDSPGAPSFGKLLGTAAKLGIYRLEFAAGNRLQRAAPDVRPDGRQPVGTTGVLAKLDNHSISISALNRSGNPLYPGVIGERHWQVTRKTVVLAGLI